MTELTFPLDWTPFQTWAHEADVDVGQAFVYQAGDEFCLETEERVVGADKSLHVWLWTGLARKKGFFVELERSTGSIAEAVVEAEHIAASTGFVHSNKKYEGAYRTPVQLPKEWVEVEQGEVECCGHYLDLAPSAQSTSALSLHLNGGDKVLYVEMWFRPNEVEYTRVQIAYKPPFPDRILVELEEMCVKAGLVLPRELDTSAIKR